jgi:uncharacterized membrane protein YdfJ with MMPL/SSD domain
MSGFWKGAVGLIVARPLIAIALAVVVVAVSYFGFTTRRRCSGARSRTRPPSTRPSVSSAST